MKWSIPAKTFLLGEYVAITGAPAIVLTTSPCFELTLTEQPGFGGIHPESPAGRWWLACGFTDKGLVWHDPYQGHGGLGASSAQFLGAYMASMHILKKEARQDAMLEAYLQNAWGGVGMRPSGYDVLAQSMRGCVYLDRQQSLYQCYTWPFQEMTFLLLHTGQKLATHHHLQAMSLPNDLDKLSAIVEQANHAFEQADDALMINAVNAYHQQLEKMDLVAEHSAKYIRVLREDADILAAKGCGAMGADVILILVPTKRALNVRSRLSEKGWNMIATRSDLYEEEALIEKIM